MKQLISQNGIKIYPKELKQFICNNCGAEFISDEYEVITYSIDNFTRYKEICFTCSKFCIIEEDNGENKDI